MASSHTSNYMETNMEEEKKRYPRLRFVLQAIFRRIYTIDDTIN